MSEEDNEAGDPAELDRFKGELEALRAALANPDNKVSEWLRRRAWAALERGGTNARRGR
jgi:hypothetical protein